jgi:2-C-methyl-D-erythritol 4-phosphate cytidylyltransferase
MSGSVRKQYIAIDGVPILRHTLKIFEDCTEIDHIILTVPDEDLDFCRDEMLTPANLQKDVSLVGGGSRRQDSVYNALEIIDADEGIVIIHDGVRPFLRQAHLVDSIKCAEETGACILGIPAFDTVKKVNPKNEIIQTHKRDTLWLAQTPQVFEVNLVKKAHEKAKQEGFAGTDDASLVERLGAVVKIIPGSRSNMKITNSEDLNLARAIMKDWRDPL